MKLVADFQDLLDDFKALQITSVFNLSQGSIKLDGVCPDDLIEKEMKKLEVLIDSVRLDTSPKNLMKRPAPKQTCEGMDQRLSSSKTVVSITTIDPVEDRLALKAWNEHLLFDLPKSLEDLPVGEEYSVSLVRQNDKDGVPRPVIRFRSSGGQSKITRRIIRARVSNLCEANSLPVIPVQFSTGMTVRLALGRGLSDDGKIYNATQDDQQDDPPNDQFHHHRRYWKTPGMGASIGMSECSHYSATLGGYVMIDGNRRILSVDHFIQEAQCCHAEGRKSSSPTLTRLSSPSRSDVDETREALDEKIVEIEQSKTDTALHTHLEIPLDRLEQFFPPDQSDEELECFKFFRNEILRDPHEFDVGAVVHRSVSGAMPQSCLQSFARSRPRHRMDWSICSVARDRRGDNMYRFGLIGSPGVAQFRQERLSPQGIGPLCEVIAEVEAGNRVHYVGQTSGFREGIVSSALVLVKDKEDGVERVSHEWGIMVEGAEGAIPKDFEGDSGAWILRDDNALLGLLWGWADRHLLFTPIQDVFADIKRETYARIIDLPPPRSTTQSATRICRLTPTKSPIRNTMPMSSPLQDGQQVLSLRLACLDENTPIRCPRSTNNNNNNNAGKTHAHGLVNLRTPSPVPSLSSSASTPSEEPDSYTFSPASRFGIAEDPACPANRSTTACGVVYDKKLQYEFSSSGKMLKRSASFECEREDWLPGSLCQSATFPCTKEEIESIHILVSV
jgi:hypothetical protein